MPIPTPSTVEKELDYLYQDKKFLEDYITIGLDQLQNLQHKFDNITQTKRTQIQNHLHNLYSDLELNQNEIDYFEQFQAYYEKLQIESEDSYPY
jgi:predicted ribosome quality control (RQC) complex YloA/Tae2 family protein